MKCRLRRGGRLAWRHVARTVDSVTPTSAAISRADMPVGSRSSICCFFTALIGQQAVLRIPRAVVVSLASDVGATLAVLGAGATSPAMRRLRKASKGFQLFGLMLPRCTNYDPNCCRLGFLLYDAHPCASMRTYLLYDADIALSSLSRTTGRHQEPAPPADRTQ